MYFDIFLNLTYSFREKNYDIIICKKEDKMMKEYKQLGAYGLVIEENKILLIKKVG
jgi:hypothetical protein